MQNRIIKEDKEKTIKYLKVGTIYKVKFTSYSHEGLAIGKINAIDEEGNKYENFPVFTFFALINEEGLVEITKLYKTYALGTLVRVNASSTSKDRCQPICPMYEKCGGCNIMHMNYKHQLEFKQMMVKDTLSHIGKLDNVMVNKVLGMDNGNGLYYRNKVQVPVSSNSNKTSVGFYQRNSHIVTPLNECFIQTKLSTEIVKFVKNILVSFGLTGYDEKKHTGDIKHIILRRNHDDSNQMVVIVTKNKNFLKPTDLNEFIKKVTMRYPTIVSIIQNVNPLTTNTILGDEVITLYGKNTLSDTLCGLKFNIGPKSFYQVNHEQCEKLYNSAISFANLSSDDIVIDAYCGIGTIGLIASKVVKHVYGVEIVKEAINNAIVNAKLNKITNATFVCNKAETQIVKWMNEGIKPTCIFVDPPRKGCDITLLNTIIEMNINKVVYISCDPATLARDLLILSEFYDIKTVQPVDMFSQTSHVENVVFLQRK